MKSHQTANSVELWSLEELSDEELATISGGITTEVSALGLGSTTLTTGQDKVTVTQEGILGIATASIGPNGQVSVNGQGLVPVAIKVGGGRQFL